MAIFHSYVKFPEGTLIEFYEQLKVCQNKVLTID